MHLQQPLSTGWALKQLYLTGFVPQLGAWQGLPANEGFALLFV
jgi:hypothetical protein